MPDPTGVLEIGVVTGVLGPVWMGATEPFSGMFSGIDAVTGVETGTDKEPDWPAGADPTGVVIGMVTGTDTPGVDADAGTDTPGADAETGTETPGVDADTGTEAAGVEADTGSETEPEGLVPIGSAAELM